MIPSDSNLSQEKHFVFLFGFGLFVCGFCLVWVFFFFTVGNIFYKQNKCLPGSYMHEKF